MLVSAMNITARIGFFALLAFIAYATLVPIDLRPNSGHLHPERICAFLALGAALSVGFPRHIIRSMAMVIFIAVALEYAQEFVPTRDARLGDALEKAAGGVAGVALGHVVLALTSKRARRAAFEAVPPSSTIRKV